MGIPIPTFSSDDSQYDEKEMQEFLSNNTKTPRSKLSKPSRDGVTPRNKDRAPLRPSSVESDDAADKKRNALGTATKMARDRKNKRNVDSRETGGSGAAAGGGIAKRIDDIERFLEEACRWKNPMMLQ